MRFLLGVIVIAALGWFGYWFFGAQAATTAFERWFDARRAEGWVADMSDISIQGFPNRFDINFNEITLADPATGWAWEAPFFQLLALSYRPNHVIAVWPHTQRIATPDRKYTLASEDMRASLVLRGDTDLAVERAILTAQSLILAATGAQVQTRAQALTLGVERVPTDPTSYRLGLNAEGFAPSQDWRTQLDPDRTLPATLEALNADVTIAFDRPWDRFAIEDARPQPRQIRIRLAQATWGQLSLQAAGTLDVDSAGVAEGTVTIKAQNWRDIVTLMRNSGQVPGGVVSALEEGLSLLARLAGNPKTLDVPLGFSKGRIWLGPVPIAAAPVLKLR